MGAVLDKALAATVVAAAAATGAVVARDARRRARARRPRVLTWEEAVERFALRCGVCGCTDDRACVTEAGACHWALEPAEDFPGLCSACLLDGFSEVEEQQGGTP